MYHFFTFLILFSFYIWGEKYKYAVFKRYWLTCIVPIMVYSIAYGLRDGWGVDFDHYKDIFDHLRDTDIGLYVINSAVKYVGLSSPFAFTIYSLILAVGFFFIVKGYKNEAIYILPLLWVTTFGASALIRFWIACGWVLMAIHFYLGKKYVKSFILFGIGISTHTSVAIFVPIVILCNLRDWFPNKRMLLIVFVLATILLDRSTLGEKIVIPLTDFLSQHVSNDRLTMYHDDADFWLSGDRDVMIAANPLFELFHRIRNGITHFIILYLGYSIKDKFKHGYFFYNMTAVSFIFYNAVQGFELVDRYVDFLHVFLSFILAFIICYQKKTPIIHNKYIFYVLIIFCYINLFYRPILGTETLSYFTTYIWD